MPEQHSDIDFGWTSREDAEAALKEKGGVLLAFLEPDGIWITAEEANETKIPVLAWGVSSEDGESMLGEDLEWVFVA